MSNKTKWIIAIISVLTITGALFAFSFYKANRWAKEVNCLYIPVDQQQVNAKECQQ